MTTELFTACGNCGTQPTVILTIQGAVRPDEIVDLAGHLGSVNGSAGGYVGSIVDISDEVATRRQLQASNEFLARAEQVAGVGAWRLARPPPSRVTGGRTRTQTVKATLTAFSTEGRASPTKKWPPGKSSSEKAEAWSL